MRRFGIDQVAAKAKVDANAAKLRKRIAAAGDVFQEVVGVSVFPAQNDTAAGLLSGVCRCCGGTLPFHLSQRCQINAILNAPLKSSR